MMPIPRRLWDSNVVIGYLAGQQDLQPDCDLIIEQATNGELEIVVSFMAQIEVAFLEGMPEAEAEARIQEFFSREYIIPVAFDVAVARITRGLIRRLRPRGIKPPDATHLAAAVLWNIPIIETTDPDLLSLDQQVGDPLIIIRRPKYEGPQRLLGV